MLIVESWIYSVVDMARVSKQIIYVKLMIIKQI